MRRRDFVKIAIAGSTVAWPLAMRAQQPPTVVGFLRPTRAEESGHLVGAVREGLRESGYPSDKVTIEPRWADGREEQLPKLARELVALPCADRGSRVQYWSTGRQHDRRELLFNSDYWQTACTAA